KKASFSCCCSAASRRASPSWASLSISSPVSPCCAQDRKKPALKCCRWFIALVLPQLGEGIDGVHAAGSDREPATPLGLAAGLGIVRRALQLGPGDHLLHLGHEPLDDVPLVGVLAQALLGGLVADHLRQGQHAAGG